MDSPPGREVCTPTTRAEGYAPGVAQQSALAQATQQQAATQAGLGTLGFDPTTGAISGTTGATGIGGYQQFLDPAAAQAGAAGTTLGKGSPFARCSASTDSGTVQVGFFTF